MHLVKYDGVFIAMKGDIDKELTNSGRVRNITINGEVDTTAPVLKKIELDKTEVKAPSTIYLAGYYHDDNIRERGNNG